jgi:hypothetical protein
MDAYLASGELRNSSHFYLNINFEVLNGCKLNCPGCFVEKNGQSPFSSNDFQNLNNLLTGLQQSLYVPFIAFVGPTDFLSGTNFSEIFNNPEVIGIFHNFKRLSLQTTFLDMKRSEEVARVLKNHYGDMELEINLVIDPAKIMDDEYLALLKNNKDKFLRLLSLNDVRNFGIMNVYNYDQTKIPDILKDYDFMHKRINHLFETTIDYNFSFGRSPHISNEEFLALSTRIKNLFDTSLSSMDLSNEKTQYLRFSFGKLTDSLIERQYNYRNGKLYYSPLLYERFVSFRDAFEVPLNSFTVEELEQFETLMQLNQYANAGQKEECGDCPFLASCVDRGILYMMDTYETKSCLVAKNALLAVNSMLPMTGSRS